MDERRLRRIEQELDELRTLRDRVEVLEEALASLRARFADLENRVELGLVGGDGLDRLATDELVRELAPKRDTLREGVTHAGRVLLVLGAAYLLRALTDSGTLGTDVGVAAGVVYAAVWFGFAYRAATRKADLSATFHGLAAAMVGFPLLWEGVFRFEVLSAALAALLLLAFSGIGLAVAHVRKLRGLALVIGGFALPTAVGMLFRAHMPPVLAGGVTVLVLGLLAMAEHHRWPILRWMTALAGDGVVALTVVLALGSRQPDWWSPGLAAVLVFALSLPVLGWMAWRVGRSRQLPRVFDHVHLVGLAGLGLAGGLRCLPGDTAVLALGGLFALGGILLYRQAVRCCDAEPPVGRYLAFLSLALVLVGGQVLPPGVAMVLWGLVAVGLAVAGTRGASPGLVGHAAVLLWVVAAVSGTLAHTWSALAGLPGADASALAGLGLAVVLEAVQVAGGRTGEGWRGLAAAAVDLVLLLGTSAWALVALARVLSIGDDPGWLAAARTGVLCAAGLLASRLGKRPRFAGIDRLVAPILVIVGIKFLAQDLPHGRPLTMFASLVFFGGALVLVSRRRGSGGSPGADAA